MTADTDLQAFLYRAVTTNRRAEQLVDDGLILDFGSRVGTVALRPGLEDFSFEAQLQARRMGDVYELLYCLENSLRELVEQTLREVLGPENWWTEGVPEKIRKAAESRKQDEVKARWHGPRGE